jgi:hypothetical protein
MTAAGVEDGRLLRAVTKGGKVKESMSGWAVWLVVEQSSKQIGIEHFGAHGLRRSAEFRIMPNRNLRTPEYWGILDCKGERIRRYRAPQTGETYRWVGIEGSETLKRLGNLSLFACLKRRRVRFGIGIMPHGEGSQRRTRATQIE